MLKKELQVEKRKRTVEIIKKNDLPKEGDEDFKRIHIIDTVDYICMSDIQDNGDSYEIYRVGELNQESYESAKDCDDNEKKTDYISYTYYGILYKGE